MLKADLHVHSVHSGHAYGTIYDIGREAARKGMEIVAITEHGPALPGGTGAEHHFHMGWRAPRELDGVRLLWGCEANIIDAEGQLDLSAKDLAQLDVVLVNFHANCGYEDQGRKENTRVMQRVLANPNIDVLSHPTNPKHEYDNGAVIETGIEHGVLMEINLAYLKRHRNADLDGFRLIVDLVRAAGRRLLVNSDAHFLHEIGDDGILSEMARQIGLTDDLILNNDIDELKLALNISDA